MLGDHVLGDNVPCIQCGKFIISGNAQHLAWFRLEQFHYNGTIDNREVRNWKKMRCKTIAALQFEYFGCLGCPAPNVVFSKTLWFL